MPFLEEECPSNLLFQKERMSVTHVHNEVMAFLNRKLQRNALTVTDLHFVALLAWPYFPCFILFRVHKGGTVCVTADNCST
jgi:hypothetical protein